LRRQSKISDYKIKKILKCFSADLTALSTAKILGFNRKTVDRYFNIFRERILEYSHNEIDKLTGEIELDESYFGARRVRGKRGRGAAGKTPVFGLLKRKGNVYVTVVKACSKEDLMPIIQGKILEQAKVYTDGWKAYDGLIVNGYDHYRVYHSDNEFVRGKCHVNGIESFWSFAKRRLSKFNGIASGKFILHLKESEFRFNNRAINLYNLLLKIIKS